MRYVDVFLCLCVATSGSGLHRVKTLALDIKIDQMETGRHELERQRRQRRRSGEAVRWHRTCVKKKKMSALGHRTWNLRQDLEMQKTTKPQIDGNI